MFETYRFKNDDSTLDRLEKYLLTELDLKGDVLLDLGGGYGRISGLLADRFSRIYMLEYSVENLRTFNKLVKDKNIIAIRGDFTRLPFREGIADCIISIRTVHHYEHPDFIIRWLRYLKDGGRLIFNINNLRNITHFFDLVRGHGINPLSGKGVVCKLEGGIRICFHSPSLIEEIISRSEEHSGFILNEHNYGFMHRELPMELLNRLGINSLSIQKIIEDGFYARFFSNFILMDMTKRIKSSL